MRKWYEVRIVIQKQYPDGWDSKKDGDLDEYLRSGRRDSGYINGLASSPRVAANRVWGIHFNEGDRDISDNEEVMIVIRNSQGGQ